MNKDLRECLRVFGRDIELAAGRRDLSAYPFVRLAESAYGVAAGARVVLDLVQASRIDDDPDDDSDKDQPLDPFEQEVLLGLVNASLGLLTERIADLKDWAEERVRENQTGRKKP